MAKRITVRGNFEWVKPKHNYLNGTKFVEDPNGKYTVERWEYSWFEKLLIFLKLKKDKRFQGSRFICGVDPFQPEGI